MPFYKSISLTPNTKLYLWKITEKLEWFRENVKLKDSSLQRLEGMKAESHQKGFLAVRMLLQHNEYTDFDLYYDEFGKPHIKPTDCHTELVEVSISHSHDFSAVVISEQKVGFDMEILKNKTLILAPRYMDVSHLENLSKEDELLKATVVWGIKESVFKIKNVIGISFKDHIFEDDFDLSDKKCGVALQFDDTDERFDVVFDFVENYVFVCAFEKEEREKRKEKSVAYNKMDIYQEILNAKQKNQKLLAILIDPDKVATAHVSELAATINESPATHIFVGGSSFDGHHLDEIIVELKEKVSLPIILFPGNPSQISAEADGILFLMLLSGRNPDYLVEHQINAVPFLEKTSLEIISTGYILIESGGETAVERISKTKPLSNNNSNYIAQTAKAGELIGNKLIYLEAGSGAQNAVPMKIIKNVSGRISVPLIVGGGIRSKKQIQEAYSAGADLVVIGTAFEIDNNFFD